MTVITCCLDISDLTEQKQHTFLSIMNDELSFFDNCLRYTSFLKVVIDILHALLHLFPTFENNSPIDWLVGAQLMS